jgi:shikimate kinase
MEKNIVLIGFMGTGKTAVGMRLSERLKRQFIDTDKEIERVSGMTIREIFHKSGEIRFRSEEALLVNKLAEQKNLVIATGGGVALNAANIESLSKNGIIVCLKATPEDIFRRVNRKRQHRPLLKKDLTVEDIRAMLEERESCYRQAEITIDTTNLEPDQIVQMILDRLPEAERK